jgi:hypothetical protein
MNEQQLAAVKQALEALETAWTYDEDNADGYYFGAIEAIKQVIAQDALNKKADNARELKQDLPFGVGGCLVAIKTLLSRDPCVHANTAIEMIDAILNTPPAAQQQWVGLTDEEMEDLWAIHSGLPLYRAIEQRLKEKNHD